MTLDERVWWQAAKCMRGRQAVPGGDGSAPLALQRLPGAGTMLDAPLLCSAASFNSTSTAQRPPKVDASCPERSVAGCPAARCVAAAACRRLSCMCTRDTADLTADLSGDGLSTAGDEHPTSRLGSKLICAISLQAREAVQQRRRQQRHHAACGPSHPRRALRGECLQVIPKLATSVTAAAGSAARALQPAPALGSLSLSICSSSIAR